jgi:hypothetical protein
MQAILLGESVILLLLVLTCVHLLQRIYRLEQLVSGAAPGAFGPSSAIDLDQLVPAELMGRSTVLFLSGTCLSCHEIAASLPASRPGTPDLVVYEEGLDAAVVASMRAGGRRLSAVPPGALSAAGVRLMPQLITVRNGRVVDVLIGTDISAEISEAARDRIESNPSEVIG